MQAVILAAGRGTRMGALTEQTPKPLLPLGNMRLIERTIRSLPKEVAEIIIVVNYHGHAIRDAIGDSYNGRPIRYVEQKERLGTGNAIHAARELLHGTFLVLMADDLYDTASIGQAMQYGWSLTAKRMPHREKAHAVITDPSGMLLDIRPEAAGDKILVCTGLYTLGEEFFAYPLAQLPNSEYSLPHTLASIAKDIPIRVLETDFWLQINTPKDLADAWQLLKDQAEKTSPGNPSDHSQE